MAAVSGSADVAAVLVHNGAAIDFSPDGYACQNALHHAAALGHVAVFDLLIRMGSDTAAVDLYGVGVVRLAGLFGREKVVERLGVVGGFPVNEGDDGDRDEDGWSVAATEFHVMYLYQLCLRSDRDDCVGG